MVVWLRFKDFDSSSNVSPYGGKLRNKIKYSSQIKIVRKTLVVIFCKTLKHRTLSIIFKKRDTQHTDSVVMVSVVKAE
jgi:hypothetical protein